MFFNHVFLLDPSKTRNEIVSRVERAGIFLKFFKNFFIRQRPTREFRKHARKLSQTISFRFDTNFEVPGQHGRAT